MDANFDTARCVNQTVTSVFETMIRLPALVSPEPPQGPDTERVTGAIGVVGEFVTGAVYLHLPEPLARRAAGAMLGLPGPAPTDGPAVGDVIGELTNMVAGGLKSALNDAGAECGMSTPSVIRGRHFAIETGPDITRSLLHFSCDNQPFSVEVHLKFN